MEEVGDEEGDGDGEATGSGLCVEELATRPHLAPDRCSLVCDWVCKQNVVHFPTAKRAYERVE